MATVPARVSNLRTQPNVATMASSSNAQQTKGLQAMGASGVGASGVGMSSTTSPSRKDGKVPDADNYWKVEQRKALSSPYGKSVPEIIKLESEGLDDWQRKLKLAVKREYFSLWQYIGGVFFGIAAGLLVANLVFLFAMDSDFTMTGEDANVVKWQWGYFLLSFFVAELIGRVEARRQFHCDPNPDKKGVDPKRRGMDCLNNRDCTVQMNVPGNLCVRKTPGAFISTIRIYVPWVLFLIGCLLLILASAPAPPTNQLAPAIMLGTSSGLLWGYFFS